MLLFLKFYISNLFPLRFFWYVMQRVVYLIYDPLHDGRYVYFEY